MRWDKDGTSLCWVLPASSVKTKAIAGRRYWKPVLGRYRNQLRARLLKEGKQRVPGNHRCQLMATNLLGF